MKSALFILWMSLISISVCAQDFTSRFLENHKPDTNLTCVTISPTMMQKVMKIDVEDEDVMMDMISKLKSMQMLTANVNGQKYYKEALGVLNKNANRFKPYISFEDKSQNFQIMTRKKRYTIVELVMLICEDDKFTVINFTGNMSKDFIAKLAKSMEPKHS